VAEPVGRVLHKDVAQRAIVSASPGAGGPNLLDHKDIRTTMIYAHVLNKGVHGVRSPVDGL